MLSRITGTVRCAAITGLQVLAGQVQAHTWETPVPLPHCTVCPRSKGRVGIVRAWVEGQTMLRRISALLVKISRSPCQGGLF